MFTQEEQEKIIKFRQSKDLHNLIYEHYKEIVDLQNSEDTIYFKISYSFSNIKFNHELLSGPGNLYINQIKCDKEDVNVFKILLKKLGSFITTQLSLDDIKILPKALFHAGQTDGRIELIVIEEISKQKTQISSLFMPEFYTVPYSKVLAQTINFNQIILYDTCMHIMKKLEEIIRNSNLIYPSIYNSIQSLKKTNIEQLDNEDSVG